MRLRRRFDVFIWALAVGSALPTAGGINAARAATGEIRLGILSIVDALPYILITEKGLDRKHGFKFSTFPFQSALERDAALQSGSADGALSDLITSTVMVSRQVDIAVAALLLGAVGQEGPFYVLGSPKNGPKSLDELREVPIGISSNTIIQYVTDRILQARGFGGGDIKTIEVKKIFLRFQMLMAGKIRAATLPDPLASLAIVLGARPLAHDIKENLSQSVTIFTGRAIREKRPALRAYARAYNEAVDAINADPDSWKDLLVRKAHLPKAIVKTYKVIPFPRLQLPTRKQVEDIFRWVKEKGLLKNPVTYDTLTTRVLLN
ncbi:MAG: ABC transporter substrate-binding protein [Nitrospinota bacterium]|nr:ABC transporter substrate-binding protein [Nitrospinota bacterium]MDP6618858.1 ABC transporter substrate-binding protein [Nitrospinota bacterium]HJM44102.1 ABC transporter substrate-binding protein [Nitrospinota bacterium]